MTSPNPPAGPLPDPGDTLDPDAYTALAEVIALTDPGPAVLAQPDFPDAAPGRWPGPHPGDGPQDAPQTPEAA